MESGQQSDEHKCDGFHKRLAFERWDSDGDPRYSPKTPSPTHRFVQCTLAPEPQRPIEDRARMDLAWISLAALLVVIVVSCTSTVNAGLLSIALAWVLGIYIAPALGTPLDIKQLVAGFPTDLCLTLIGVTLLFSQAQV